MLDKGVLYEDARCEFEKMFISRALQRTKGNLGDAAEMLGMHRNTDRPENGGVPNQTKRLGPRSERRGPSWAGSPTHAGLRTSAPRTLGLGTLLNRLLDSPSRLP